MNTNRRQFSCTVLSIRVNIDDHPCTVFPLALELILFSSKLAVPFDTCFGVSFDVVTPRGDRFVLLLGGDSSDEVCFALYSM